MARKKLEHWARLTVAFAIAGWASVACASNATEASGETHFVTCKVDNDCVSLGGAYSCQGGSCKPKSNYFANCTNPPPSSCSRKDTCAELHCGSVEFDDAGCARSSCKSDSD